MRNAQANAALPWAEAAQGPEAGRRRRDDDEAPELICSSRFERRARQQGARRVAGVDEVGRGALFGPVVAAAVILDPLHHPRGLNDSKRLTREEREALAPRIRRQAIAWALAAVDAGRIDCVNIYQASRLAMRAAVEALAPPPDWLLVDAVPLDWSGPQQAIVHGDALSFSIAAASILAKVHRDELLRKWDAIFPAYRLGSNKGYSTPDHLAALNAFGCTPLHRRSYLPVAMQLSAAETWLPFPPEDGGAD